MLYRYWQSYDYNITEDFFEDIANDVTKWFDTSSCDENGKRPLPMGVWFFQRLIRRKYKERICCT